jgi:hypothetical protein
MSHGTTDKPAPSAREFQKIGFNESVLLDSRKLHVQTEVLVKDRVLVKTTILEGGVVRFVDSDTCPIEGRTLEDVEAFVLAQHRRNVERARNGTGV